MPLEKGKIKSEEEEIGSGNEHRINEVDIQEEFANVGVNWLKHLMAALQEKAEKQPEPCRKWVVEIQKILDRRLQRPTVQIALFGPSGAGKSSIISAICDRHIVHCNAMQAGTEFITVIGYNHEATPENLWRGEVQTITEHEWAHELETLLGDLYDLPDGEIPSPGSNSETGYALAKILAVYPEANPEQFRNWTVNVLVNHADLRAVCGHAHQYSGRTLTAVKKQMEKFTGSRRRPRYSPLISMVKIFGPIEFLRRGLEIADVPGSGDSNAARCRVADQYQSKVDAFWIVSPIVRAVDDNISKSLFGTAWKRQMEFDGRLTEECITFIMTKCDDITVSQVLDDLDMTEDEEVLSLRAQERSAEKEIRKHVKLRGRLGGQIVKEKEVVETVRGNIVNLTVSRKSYPGSSEIPESSSPFDKAVVTVEATCETRLKRTRNDVSKSAGEALNASKRQKRDDPAAKDDRAMVLLNELTRSIDEMNEKLLVMDGTIATLKNHQQIYRSQLTKLAISARNEFSVGRIRASFSKEVHGPQQGDTQTLSVEDTKSLPVFCVSSKAYEQHRRRNVDDQRVEGYPHINDTQVPLLREHCIKAALNAQQKFAAGFSSDLESLIAEMKTWAEDKEPERTISVDQKDLLLKTFNDPFSNLFKTISESFRVIIRNMNGVLKSEVQSGIAEGATSASQTAPKIVEGWFNKNGPGALQWATVRACARRRGAPHKARGVKYRNGFIELNADLAEPFRKTMASGWKSLFFKLPSSEAERAVENFALALGQFLEQMDNAVASACQTMSLKWELLRRALERLIRPTVIGIQAVFDRLHERSRDIHRSILHKIARAMRPAYDECGVMRGTGVALVNRTTLTQHIKTVAPTMYNDAAKNMNTALEGAMQEFKKEIKREINATLASFKDDYEEMVITASRTVQSETLSHEKVLLQTFILDHISRLVEAQVQVRSKGSRASDNPFANAARVDIPDSSAQVGEDDYVSEESDDSSDEYKVMLSDDDYRA